MASWQEYIQDWGYLAVFLGSLIEGESVILVAGFFVHEGYLSLSKIIIASFLGTLIADQGCYFIGRYYGNALIDKFPSQRPRVDRAFELLRRYDNLFILTCRFIYGIRTISPFVVGASGVEVKRFIILNLIAAFIWSVTSCVGAYYFAYIIMEHIHFFPKITLGLLLFAGGAWYGFHKWRNRNL